MTITCPKCGFNGQLDLERRPSGVRDVSCPGCGASFDLSEAEEAVFTWAGQGGREGEQQIFPLCHLCNGSFPPEQLELIGDKRLCTGCSPTYRQMQAIGMAGDTYRFGGFWIRLAAKLVDGLAIWGGNTVIGLLITFLISGSHSPTVANAASIFTMLLQLAFGIFYNSWFLIGVHQATPGKRLFGLKVIDAAGGKLTGRQAVMRYFAEMLSGLILMIGYIMAAFDDQKRTLHDRICKSRVVYR